MSKEIVYHGTTKENAIVIIENKDFLINEDEENKLYLGCGVYFFEKSVHAVAWNIRLFQKKNMRNPIFSELLNSYAVVAANLDISEENILDFDDLEDNKLFDMLVMKIKRNFNLDINGDYVALINFMQRNKLIDDVYVVKKIFTLPIRGNRWGRLKNISRIVYCVKNKNVIGDLKEVPISEKEFNSAVYYS